MATEKQHRHHSVFGEIVDWTLAPLLILWPISMAIQYFLAYTIANNAYDRELQNRVYALARQVSYVNGKLNVSLPPAAAAVLRFDEVDEIFFQVRDPRNEVVAGDKAIPVVEFTPELEPNAVYFRDDVLPQFEVRVAYIFAQVPELASAVLVQVAETNNKRSNLASQIIGDVLAAQFIIVPVALLFVWLGLEKGLEPLNELQQQIRRRKPGDLSPIREDDAPEEVRPLIRSINELMGRLEASMKAQQRFVADAAHQMRTPLAGLEDAGGARHAPARRGRRAAVDAADRRERGSRLAPHQPAAAAGARRRRRAAADGTHRSGTHRAARRRWSGCRAPWSATSTSGSRARGARAGSTATRCCCRSC